MKVYIEFIAEDGTRYFYPNRAIAKIANCNWYLPNSMYVNNIYAREILNDGDNQIPYIEQLARTKGWEMKLMPINMQIGTYLSTYKYDSVFHEKFLLICFLILLFAIIALISFLN